MLRTFVGLVMLALFALPSGAQDKKKPAVDVDKDETKAVGESKKKLFASGKIAGKLTQVEGTSKYLTVQVTVKIQKPNLQALQSISNLQAQMAQASQRRDLNRVLDLQRQLAQQRPYSLEDFHHKIELHAADDMKVRMFTLPLEYDDKGKPRKYTAKELADLKEDPKLPGYKADYENLRVGQEVEVTFLRPKTTPKPRAVKDKDRDLVVEEERLKATMVVILRDPPAK